jgi:hypothetical protein
MSEAYEDIKVIDDEQLTDPMEYLADIPARMISGVLGLMAFMVSCIVGLIAGNPGYVILLRAMLAMFVCTLIGRVLGMVGEMCVREYVSQYKTNRPRPIKPRQLVQLENERKAHDEVIKHLKKAA